MNQQNGIKRPNRIYNFLQIVLLVFLFSSIHVFAGGDEPHLRDVNQKLADVLDGIPYREMLYNKDFQIRFSLPSEGVAALDNGLLAIALEAQVSSSGSQFLHCGLHLYVDSGLVKLILPSSKSGFNPSSTTMKGYFFNDRHIINDSDGKYRIASLHEYNSRILIQSDTYPKGVTSMSSLQNYTINLYPGISHFYFSPHCNALNINKSGAVNIWLNKTSDPQNLPAGNAKGNSLLSYKFTLPKRLSQSFSPIIEQINSINAKNRSVFFSFMRKHRELLNSEKGFTIPAK